MQALILLLRKILLVLSNTRFIRHYVGVTYISVQIQFQMHCPAKRKSNKEVTCFGN